VGIVGGPAKVGQCRADTVVDKSSEDWVAAARRVAPEGYCAIFDANGVSTLAQSYGLLSRNGRLVVYGFHSNLPKSNGGLGTLSPVNWARMALGMLWTPHFDPMDLTLSSKAVLGFNLSFFAEEKELCECYLKQIGKWMASGQIVPPATQTFALEGVRDAHVALASGRTVGKLVVTL